MVSLRIVLIMGNSIRYKIRLLLLVAGMVVAVNIRSQEVNLEGQLSGWVTARHDKSWASQAGVRYLPEFNFTLPLSRKGQNSENGKEGNLSFEGEFSLNAISSWTYPSETDNIYEKIKPYRAWIKFGGDQFEIRAGLQKINFGSASMLRSLMWFDRIDARDPLQLTDGVYSLLGRYYFLNNANIWLWGLYGNKGTKGWDYLESDLHRPEFGGRLQLPVPRAEIAFTYNNRLVNDNLPFINSPEKFSFSEQKLAFDVKADLVIGLWYEGVMKFSNTDLFPRYDRMTTLGSDYTFGIGNGVNMSLEYLNVVTSDEPFKERVSSRSFIGLSANYPLSLVAGLSAIAYLNPDSGDLYRFVNLSLSYDQLSFYFIGFWNPTDYELFNIDNQTTMFTGKGFQVMAVFNY